jgi:hypothetical protein
VPRDDVEVVVEDRDQALDGLEHADQHQDGGGEDGASHRPARDVARFEVAGIG